MRRFLPLFLVLVLLNGCGQRPPSVPAEVTETEVELAYLSAEEVYGWFNLCSLPTTGDSVEADGQSYRAVDHAGLTTYADLETKVRSLFVPELADQILSGSSDYQDIDGTLYCAEGARGSNIYLKERVFSAERTGDDRWAVTVTFYADNWDAEWERPSVTIGYSQTVLDYVKTEDGWRFESICPADDLDLDAETVFHFTYDEAAFESTDFDRYSDLQLALYLLHSDGAYTEGPSDLLYRRFTKRPAQLLSVLAGLHIEWQAQLISLIAGAAAYWYPDDDLAALLDGLTPDGAGEIDLVTRLRERYEEGRADELAGRVTLPQEFSLGPLTEQSRDFAENQPLYSMLQLGVQDGTYPWGYELLSGTPEPLEGGDLGQDYTVVSGNLNLQYMAADGQEYLIAMTTADDSPATSLWTRRGARCGNSEAVLKEHYPDELVWLDKDQVTSNSPLPIADHDGAWLYEPGPGFLRIFFYMKDGAVAAIEVVNGIDG